MSLRGSYLAHCTVSHTTNDAADSAVFAMHNPAASGVLLKIKRINLVLSFDGTGVAATRVGYHLIRFTVADPTTGTAVPRIKKNAGMTNSILADANIQRKGGILTMTGVVYEAAPFCVFRLPTAVTNGSREVDLRDALELRPDEGLAVRTNTAVPSGGGQNLDGYVEWDEKTL